MIRAFLYDLDGTLFKTDDANVHAYRRAFAEVGLEFDEAKYRELFGLRYPEMMRGIAPSATENQLSLIRERKVDFYKESLEFVVPNFGLLAHQASVRLHFRTALVTTASRNNVNSLLEHFNIDDGDFDGIITGEHVTHGKPDPECYLLAADLLKVATADCCVFEDSDVGIQAATLAGTQVIRVSL